MRAIASITFTLISAFTWNAWAFQSASPPAAREPYTAARPPDQPHSNTKVAIAWFSDVEGEVQLASAYGKEFQPALAHTPITQGNFIRTGIGRAEVELEDHTTIRLGPFSVIAFPRLELLPSGAKMYTVRSLRGTVYISLIPNYIADTKGNDFQLTFGLQQVYLKPSGHVRLEMDPMEARLVILDGKGQVNGPFGSMELARKRTFTFNLKDQSQPVVVKKVAANPLDKWDTAVVASHQSGTVLPRMAYGFFTP